VLASLPPAYVSQQQAAERMGVSVQTVRAMCDRHEVIWRRCGRRIVVDAASLRPVDGAVVDLAARRACR